MDISNIVALILLAIVLIFFIAYFCALIISQHIGVPFVPTRTKDLVRIFSHVKLKNTDTFYDLGCGNGSVVLFAAKHSQACCIGIELNVILYKLCLLRKKYFENAPNAYFEHNDIYATDLNRATVIYFFLYPEIIAQLSHKLLAQCKKNTLIIAHGFKIKGWSKKRIRTITKGYFKTYFYRV